MLPIMALARGVSHFSDTKGTMRPAEYWIFCLFCLGLIGLAGWADVRMAALLVAEHGGATLVLNDVALGRAVWPEALSLWSFWTPMVLIGVVLPLVTATLRRLNDAHEPWYPMLFVVVPMAAMALVSIATLGVTPAEMTKTVLREPQVVARLFVHLQFGTGVLALGTLVLINKLTHPSAYTNARAQTKRGRVPVPTAVPTAVATRKRAEMDPFDRLAQQIQQGR